MLSAADKEKIDSVYYNLRNGGAFLSATKVHQILKSKGYNSPNLNQIRRYIQSLDDYSLQKPVRRAFKRARVEVSGPFEQYDADLADMSNISKQNSGYCFLLVVIDVFSRFLWMEPVKTKTAKEVLKAMRTVVSRGRIPKRMRTDKGSEFDNRLFRKWCTDNNVHYFTTQNETKANYVERVIKTLKTMMYRYFTKYRTYKYIDKLQDFVRSYNATPHRSLNGLAPKDVNESNKVQLFAYMYLRNKKHQKRHKISFKFNVGDLVRITHLKQPFTRAYQQQWSSEIFKIQKRFLRQGIPQYRLIDFQNEDIKGNFYQSELQKVDKDEDALWFIEKKIRKRKKNGRVEWLVQFEGWPSKYNQWIPENDIKDVKGDEDVTLRSDQ